MFNQQAYVNKYIKDNYKTIKLRIKNDDILLLSKLGMVNNVNGYIRDLIQKDINENRKYNYINNDVRIDFVPTKTLQYLIDEAEAADLRDDYGDYMNIVYAIDARCKKEVGKHIISESQWNKMLKRYQLW